ncbi:SDR family NAD(P)-dependent oxidoreductase [Reichenbachiella sp.]|uniref:SDR family NAD(P)-dependent oxidoreductase n=1 Tax=Reichenbachiella sp. TaxID=2184521 RepID=UPI003B5CBEB2
MQTISILGCGWLGLPLGKHLSQSGFQVKGSTTNKDKLPLLEKAGIQPFHLILNPYLAGDPAEFFESDITIVNLPPRNQNGAEDFHENQLKSILECIQSEKVIFISSTAVYPANNKVVNEEDASSACMTRGGIPLLKMEHLFSNNPAFETTVIRFGGLYGPDRHPGKFLAGKKDLAGANSPINMIHLDDCIGVIQTIIERNLWGVTINACAPSEETRQSFYEKAAKSLDIEAPTFSDEGASFKKVSAEKLIRMTGYQFKH